jgi:hypothetical protein
MRRTSLYVAIALFISLGFGSNSGAVDFAPAKSYTVGTSPSSVVIGDFNGDGKPDIAVANAGSGNVSILLGNGDGTFQAAVSFDAGAGPQEIALGDFNADHKLDLAVLLVGDATNGPGFSVLLGNGDGTFQGPHFLPLESIAAGMAVVDFNLDKKSDIAITIININQQIVSLLVFISSGDGTFESPKDLTLPIGEGGSLATGDFNKDGKPDLVMDGPGGYNILLGKGDGTFQPLSAVLVASNFSGAGVQVADLDHDGVADLIAYSIDFQHSADPEGGRSLTAHLSVFLGNGNGTFQAEQVLATASFAKSNIFAPPVGDAISPAAVGDFDGGGNLDLLFLRKKYFGFSFTSSGNMMLGKGDGTFPQPFPINISFAPSAVADLNGDNLYDLLSLQGNSVAVSMNTSPIVYALTVAFSGDGSGSISSSPAGIRCESSGGNCLTGQILPGTTYTLAASPAGNSTFTGWGGACSGEDPNGCSVTLNSNMNVTVEFSLPPDFTLSPAATSLILKRGGQASEVLTFPAQGGFSGTIALACSVSGSAPMPTCGISPNSVTPGSTTTLTINASALSASLTAPWFEQGASLYAAGLPLGLFGCVLAMGFDKKRRRMWALCILIVATTIFPAACGSGSSVPPPPVAQSYTVTVTATSGALQHSTAISITVQ